MTTNADVRGVSAGIVGVCGCRGQSRARTGRSELVCLNHDVASASERADDVADAVANDGSKVPHDSAKGSLGGVVVAVNGDAGAVRVFRITDGVVKSLFSEHGTDNRIDDVVREDVVVRERGGDRADVSVSL